MTVNNCVFKDHLSNGISGTSGDGDSQLIVTNSLFDDYGDGITVTDVTTTVTNCSIRNSSSYGINASSSNLTIDHSLIDRNMYGLSTSDGCVFTLTNSVVRNGGTNGIALYDNLGATITNNWIHRNGIYDSCPGIFFDQQISAPLVRNNTIYDNYTYGIESGEDGADPNIVNCIIYGNASADLYRDNGTFDTVNYCNLQSAHAGTGNIIDDPCFKNVGSDPNDLHLDGASQCKDAGDPDFADANETDIDGEARIRYGRVDIGADEYYWSHADLDQSGSVDFADYAEFAAAWQTAPNDANYNEDCDFEDNNAIDYNDLALFCEDWLWKVAWQDTQWMMAMGQRGGLESLLAPQDRLMLPDAAASLKAMSEEMLERTQKFYAIVPARTLQPSVQEIDIKEILKWLADLWLEEEQLQKMFEEDEWLKFIEAVENSL